MNQLDRNYRNCRLTPKWSQLSAEIIFSLISLDISENHFNSENECLNAENDAPISDDEYLFSVNFRCSSMDQKQMSHVKHTAWIICNWRNSPSNSHTMHQPVLCVRPGVRLTSKQNGKTAHGHKSPRMSRRYLINKHTLALWAFIFGCVSPFKPYFNAIDLWARNDDPVKLYI